MPTDESLNPLVGRASRTALGIETALKLRDDPVWKRFDRLMLSGRIEEKGSVGGREKDGAQEKGKKEVRCRTGSFAACSEQHGRTQPGRYAWGFGLERDGTALRGDLSGNGWARAMAGRGLGFGLLAAGTSPRGGEPCA